MCRLPHDIFVYFDTIKISPWSLRQFCQVLYSDTDAPHFSMEPCQSKGKEVEREMIAIKQEVDPAHLVKVEDESRELMSKMEADSQQRKNKLLEQVSEHCATGILSFR